nr:putative wax ester synthase/acyl-CoA:diacylglycerol acyltransferase [uncultured bacterium]
MHQLSRSEAALFGAETVTNLGHYSIYLELAPDSEGECLQFQRLRSLLAERIHLAPSLRRRVREVPLGLDDPWWIEDPHFDLDYHVRHLAVPGASDPDALEQLLARLHERPLDRSRPLWEIYLIDHPDATVSLFIKIHLVLTDELGPLGPLTPALANDLLPEEKTAWRPDMLPSDSDLLIKAGWSTLFTPSRSIQRSLELAQRIPLVGRLAVLASNISNAPAHPVEAARRDQAVPRASFNRTLGSHRRVARAELPLAQMREIHTQLDVRVHDVLLAAVSGALRHWLVIHDELIAESLVALTPLLIDAKSDKLGAALVPLSTERHDPLQRVAEISMAMTEITEQIEPQSIEAIRAREGIPIALAGAASQLVVTATANLRFMPPFNIYVVNIPGIDLDNIDGFPIAHKHALCPLIDGIGLSMSAISHDDAVHVTLVADRDLVPDLDVIANRLSVELDILAKAAAKVAAPKRKPRKKKAS